MDPAARPAARVAGIAVALALGASACSGGDRAGDAPTTLDWQAAIGTVETATLTVPLDHDEPDGETIELLVARRPADDPDRRVGTLLVNPGGPGFGGTELVTLAEQSFGAELLERFDIVGWDPRGTGRSTPTIDCIDDHDARYDGLDTSPDDAAEEQLLAEDAAQFAAGCVDRTGDLLQHAGTNDSARDMDLLRRALGEREVSYLGFSYGSELGTTWAAMYPDTVRAAVLDGAAAPNSDPVERALARGAGFEAAIGAYLDACSADATCPFHHDGDAAEAFDALIAGLDAEPIPSTPGRPDITSEIALRAVAQGMYAEAYWDQLSAALAAAETGDGSGLLALWDAYQQRQPDGTWTSEVEAGQVVTCMDRAERLTEEEAAAARAELVRVAPRYAPGLGGLDECSELPAPSDPRVSLTAAGDGPIVVIGTTGDPATPLDGTRAMADELEDGRLVVVTANQHTGYGANECVDQVVHRYLVDLEVPADETAC